MADKKSMKKSDHPEKQKPNPAPDATGSLPDPDLEISRGRPALVDPNPEFDPGQDEGNLPAQQKVPGGSLNYHRE